MNRRMMNNDFETIKDQVTRDGFAITGPLFSEKELAAISQALETINRADPGIRQSQDLFAIRHLFKALPQLAQLVVTHSLKSMIDKVFGTDYFIIKSIYFDKPESSNWFVPYHQDLMISVDRKADIAGYGPWTNKPGQVAVQPPVALLEDNFTLRLHLDDTDAGNGALKVIPGSHLKGICRPETIDRTRETETLCAVQRGAIMIMKPLLLHASGRSQASFKRRVIHIECSRTVLPPSLQWSEYHPLPL